jgi:hypothetical protein
MSFDWKYYLDKYSDLRKNGVHTENQALNHWKKFGAKEGRIPFNVKNIKDILYCQPIFAPNLTLLNKNINSLNSIHEYLTKYNLTHNSINFCFGGWTINDEYWNIIYNKIKELFNVEAIRFDKNYGKAYVVNKLVKYSQKIYNFKYIFTLDSDIIIDVDESNMFERLIICVGMSELILNKKCGLIALNQKICNCHMNCVYENSFNFNSDYKKEKIVYPNGYGGIAGGCLFIPLESWNIVNGYRVMGVYAGDDAYILLDLYNKNMSIQMVDSINCIHPIDTDEKYSLWKVHVCQRDQKKINIDSLDEKINDADKFWKSY